MRSERCSHAIGPFAWSEKMRKPRQEGRVPNQQPIGNPMTTTNDIHHLVISVTTSRRRSNSSTTGSACTVSRSHRMVHDAERQLLDRLQAGATPWSRCSIAVQDGIYPPNQEGGLTRISWFFPHIADTIGFLSCGLDSCIHPA